MDFYILKLAAHGRLLTRGRMRKRGMKTSPLCPLCLLEVEIYCYTLFFHCWVISRLWKTLLAWEELAWVIVYCKGRRRGAALYKMSLAAAIYYVWQARNYQVFQQRQRIEEAITWKIIQEVYHRTNMYPKLADYVAQFDNYPT